MILYTFFRSSTAFRVRIACQLKGIAVTQIPVNLLREGGEQNQAPYRSVSPGGGVPSLDIDGNILTQSLAIIEYLDECYPQPPLLPAEPLARAHAREIACHVACDMHPLINLRVLNHLAGITTAGDAAKDIWARKWIEDGFAVVEKLLQRHGSTGRFCIGDGPTLADICLVPQVVTARRFAVAVERFPTVLGIHDHCMQIDAFRAAAPQNQPDAV